MSTCLIISLMACPCTFARNCPFNKDSIRQLVQKTSSAKVQSCALIHCNAFVLYLQPHFTNTHKNGMLCLNTSKLIAYESVLVQLLNGKKAASGGARYQTSYRKPSPY